MSTRSIARRGSPPRRLPPCAPSDSSGCGFTLRQDFEGDQFTFLKPFAFDLDRLYGLEIQELAIYESLEAQGRVPVARGVPVLVEVDAIHLPDTAGTTYGREHSKTMIAILRRGG